MRNELQLVVIAALVGLLIFLLVGTFYLVGGFSFIGSCSEEERKVYAEFPQFGDAKIEPEPFQETGGCAAFYDTQASQEQVAEYYTRQLKDNGWEVERLESETTVLEGEKETFEEVEIIASRGDFFYNVLFESHQYYDPPRPGVHVAVHVFDG